MYRKTQYGGFRKVPTVDTVPITSQDHLKTAKKKLSKIGEVSNVVGRDFYTFTEPPPKYDSNLNTQKRIVTLHTILTYNHMFFLSIQTSFNIRCLHCSKNTAFSRVLILL